MRLPIFSASSRSWLTKTMVFLQLLLEVEELVLELVADQRVERRERLVHEQDRRRRWRRRGRGRRAAACRRTARREYFSAQFDRPTSASFSSTIRLRSAGGRAAHLEAEADILAHRPPGQERELLEHHRDGAGAELAERLVVALADVDRPALVLDRDGAAGDRVEPVDGAEHGRLAGAGQAHQHADLAALDGEADVDRAGHAVGRGDDLLAARAAIEQREAPAQVRRRRRCRRARTRLPACYLDAFRVRAGSLQTRSSRMARTTMARPASKPMRH